MHYACQSFDEVKSGFPEIYAIVLQEHGTSNGLHTFTCDNFACEKELLQEFFDFLRRRKHHKFLHWNMNDEKFGLRAIEGRYKQLYKHVPYKLSPNQSYDFDDMIEETFGRNYIHSQRKFLGLLERNGLNSPDIFWGADEAALFKEGDSFRGRTSTVTKTRALDKLVTLYFNNELHTDSPPKKQRRKILIVAAKVVGAIIVAVGLFNDVLGIRTFFLGLIP